MTVLRFLVANDCASSCFFFDDNGRIVIHENCNDLFEWACADSEEITVADIPEYQKSIDDCRAISNPTTAYAGSLWACRKRGMRPQRPAYRQFNNPEIPALYLPRLVELFDACGPYRKD